VPHDGEPLERRDDGPVRTLRGARGASGLAALTDALHAAAADPAVRCVLLTGLDAHSPDPSLEDARGVADGALPSAVAALASLATPTVAVLTGTVGGVGLALACAADLRVVAQDAVLHPGTGELPPQGGLSWTLPRLVGHGRATDLLLRPRPVTAEEALRIGLVTQVVPDDGVDAAAARLAAGLAAGPALVQTATKRSLAHGAEDGLVGTMQLETQRAAMLRRTHG
jgi:2-(1,2-epoxy-1,2-dihydrophenyl)acetyl-CoA isomerase